MSKPSFIHELKLIKQFSLPGRAILVIAGVVLLLGGGIGGYLAGESAASTSSANSEKDSNLATKNYQLKFEGLEEEEVKGEASEGLKLTYRGEEIEGSEIELSPKEGSKKINLQIVLGSEKLNLILPLFSAPKVVATTNSNSTGSSEATKTTGKYVASKSGGKYHLLDCRYAKKMKEENKIWYGSKEEAEADGKDSCGVCKP
ncbi:hypothetical protein E3J85_01335 [Patescibacteria group bacterium]|nr:MAG: hypothetical protein E3J85_01335 [Patescibacteria group bacterium]